MFSHITISIDDFSRALAFYKPLMKELGIALKFVDHERSSAGWQSTTKEGPAFLIERKQNSELHLTSNKLMVSFSVASREAVNRVYLTALSCGGSSERAPALCPEYHEHHYAAFFKDTEGNEVSVACDLSESFMI